jgi:hypothetical protein
MMGGGGGASTGMGEWAAAPVRRECEERGEVVVVLVLVLVLVLFVVVARGLSGDGAVSGRSSLQTTLVNLG